MDFSHAEYYLMYKGYEFSHYEEDYTVAVLNKIGGGFQLKVIHVDYSPIRIQLRCDNLKCGFKFESTIMPHQYNKFDEVEKAFAAYSKSLHDCKFE